MHLGSPAPTGPGLRAMLYASGCASHIRSSASGKQTGVPDPYRLRIRSRGGSDLRLERGRWALRTPEQVPVVSRLKSTSGVDRFRTGSTLTKVLASGREAATAQCSSDASAADSRPV